MTTRIMGKVFIDPGIRRFFEKYPFVRKYCDCDEDRVCCASTKIINEHFFNKDLSPNHVLLDKEGNALMTIENHPIPYRGKVALFKLIDSLLDSSWLTSWMLLPFRDYTSHTLNGALEHLRERVGLAYMVVKYCDLEITLYEAPNGMSFNEWGKKLISEYEKAEG